jgi:hypothetical protein
MAVLSKSKVPSGHWYRPDGTPVHKLPTPDGKGERPTTIRAAKRLGLYPSVTSILSILAKPGWRSGNSTRWRWPRCARPRRRGIRGVLVQRVRNAAFEQVEQAADLGTMIHAALELAMAGEPYPDDLRPYVEPVMAWKQQTGIEIIDREIRLVNKQHGFAGTADVLFRYGRNGIGILDYKTRKTKPGEEVTAYDNQAMQLAAYGATYWGEENVGRLLAANVFISTTEPGRVVVVKHPDVTRTGRRFAWSPRCGVTRKVMTRDSTPRHDPRARHHHARSMESGGARRNGRG